MSDKLNLSHLGNNIQIKSIFLLTFLLLTLIKWSVWGKHSQKGKTTFNIVKKKYLSLLCSLSSIEMLNPVLKLFLCKVCKVLSERYCYVKQYYDVKCSTETNIHICNFKANIACLPTSQYFVQINKERGNNQMFQDKDISVSFMNQFIFKFMYSFLVDSRQVLCVPIICRSSEKFKNILLE